jgi:hypothetical protein
VRLSALRAGRPLLQDDYWYSFLSKAALFEDGENIFWYYNTYLLAPNRLRQIIILRKIPHDNVL